jgi:Ni,Fe-hydrogenase I cytochrome b subunit
MKQNYDKHVERMENWKDIVEEEHWVSKARLVPLFLMDWQASMPDVMLEFLNTFLIKGAYIYFGHKDKVYVISKQLIVDAFGACVEGYVEKLKG